jgi:hypothetical protein
MSVSMARDVLSRERLRGTPPPDHDNVALDAMDSPCASPKTTPYSDGYIGTKTAYYPAKQTESLCGEFLFPPVLSHVRE